MLKVPNPRYLNGHEFEKEFFGIESNFSQAILADMRKLNLDVWESVEGARKSQVKQKWDPERGSTDLSRLMFFHVRECLSNRQKPDLRLYSSLGMISDFFYGIDGFFSVSSNPDLVVTFDLTLDHSESKRRCAQANLLIYPEDFYDYPRLTALSNWVAGYLEAGLADRNIVSKVGPL